MVAADVVDGKHDSTFANWRWSKLWDGGKAVEEVFGPLSSVFATPRHFGRDEISSTVTRRFVGPRRQKLGLRLEGLDLHVNAVPTRARLFACDGYDERLVSRV